MAWAIILTIIALPLLEVAIFIEVARAIGILPAIAGAVIAGIAGLALWRQQGLATMLKAQSELHAGRMPVAALFDGVCLALAGAMLLLPGYLSDIIALILIFPPTRHLLRGILARRFVVVDVPAGHRGGPTPQPRVIEVDYEEIRPDDDDRSPPPPRP